MNTDNTMALQDPVIRTSSDSTLRKRDVPNYPTATSESSEQQTVSHPAASRLPAVFPQYMCSAIRKNNDKAVITMVFPYRLGVVCLMSLAILSNKIAYLATELFGVHIEIDGGFRYVNLGNGVRLLPQQALAIQGGRDGAITTLLGLVISKAINVSPARKEEMSQAILVTRCVTMEITSNPDEEGVLNLNLGQDEGYRVKEALFD